MDKKKVLELIEKGMIYQSKSSSVSSYKEKAKNCFEEAIKELSKSDWVSAYDELPPYKERVIVCNNQMPKKVWMTYRSESDYFIKDDNDFVLYGDYEPSITHWRKIDKLEV